MKKCPDCAEQVQPDARICRFCRHEFPQPSKPSPSPYSVTPAVQTAGWKTMLWGFNGLLFVTLAVVIMKGLPSKPVSNAKTTVEATKPKPSAPSAGEIKIRAERSLRAALRDPDSMKTRNTRVPFGKAYLCGEVNARNGFGGLTGFKRFIAGAAQEMPTAIDDGSTLTASEFDRLWRQAC